MAKAKVYTRKGDAGETGLASGTRVSKSDLRIDCYGEVDELNSFIGYFRSVATEHSTGEQNLFDNIQSQLFNMGSILATEKEKREKLKIPCVERSIVDKLEQKIDELEIQLTPLKNFILPGGGQSASLGHCCRTICRRVERKLVLYCRTNNEELSVELQFLNRLSDFFFVYSRYLSMKDGNEETLWSS
jgi:cob(I)alamin adenosyltransferase